jgi:hypothetical protein
MTKSVRETIREESMDKGGKNRSMVLGYVDEGACRVPKRKK